eukprot:765104-Hanusia_phi.AAC.1
MIFPILICHGVKEIPASLAALRRKKVPSTLARLALHHACPVVGLWESRREHKQANAGGEDNDAEGDKEEEAEEGEDEKRGTSPASSACQAGELGARMRCHEAGLLLSWRRPEKPRRGEEGSEQRQATGGAETMGGG